MRILQDCRLCIGKQLPNKIIFWQRKIFRVSSQVGSNTGIFSGPDGYYIKNEREDKRPYEEYGFPPAVQVEHSLCDEYQDGHVDSQQSKCFTVDAITYVNKKADLLLLGA